MFGYVRVYQPELKMGEWEQYRGVYCSLCKTLGRRYGLPARFLLSYDLTLLALFHMALAPECTAFRAGRCSFNPAKKCPDCTPSPALELAADTAVLLTYYKFRDDLSDERGPRRLAARLGGWLTAPMKRRAARKNPALAEQMAAYAAAQQQIEATGGSVDAAAAPTAALMAALTAGDTPEGEERQYRERFGYCLGRWIYLMDAADDWEKDRKRGGFNPFAPTDAGAAPKDYMREVLNLSLSECLTAWHLLDRHRFDPILQNILKFGMPAEMRRVCAAENEVTAHDRPV